MRTNTSTWGRGAALAAGVAFVAVAAGALGAALGRGRGRPERREGSTSALSEGRGGEGDAVRSVYPPAGAPADPLAERLCEALQGLPVSRMASCRATTPGVVLTSECVRTLGAALRAKAVTLAARDVDRCVEATDRGLAGCEWVGRLAPPPPAECLGIVRGQLVAGAICASSLECLEGLSCEGLGPTNPGRCAGPRPDRGDCGGSVDVLAAYTKQNDVGARHPECAGWCSGRRCAPAVAEGDGCKLAVQCGRGGSCIAGRCVATRRYGSQTTPPTAR